MEAHRESGDFTRVDDTRLESESPNQLPKAKRARYVSTACNECKRRKVKCDGEEPCLRCVNGMIQCSYWRGSRSETVMGLSANSLDITADPTAATNNGITQMATNLQTVMDQVKCLQGKLDAISQQESSTETAKSVEPRRVNDQTMTIWSEMLPAEGQVRPVNQAENSQTTFPEYHGPTSSEFSFNVANKILTGLGADCSVDGEAQVDSPLPFQTGKTSQADGFILRRTLRQDPLWRVDQSDVPRYIDAYRDSLGAMYPILDCEPLKAKADMLFQAMMGPCGQKKEIGLGSVVELIFNNDTQVLKIILAIGLLNDMSLADNGTALSLVQSVLDSSDTSLMHVRGLEGVHILMLCGLFYMTLDDEIKAGRYACLAARACLEMGLHRRDTLVKSFPERTSQRSAIRTFWSVFMLDRRVSIGLGVPYVIQDTLIDPTLTQVNHDHQYLQIMIPYTRLSGKVWQMGNEFGIRGLDVVAEEVDYLDYQVSQWLQSIPESIRYSPGIPPGSDVVSQQHFYLSVVLHVRGNQLRNILCRPLLQSSDGIKTNPQRTSNAVRTAKESLQVFLELDAASDILWTHATFFKHFIVSALGNLLLIVLHATDEYLDEVCDIFYLGLALMRKLSKRSPPVMRMWGRLKGLENLQAKLASTRRRAQNYSSDTAVSIPDERSDGELLFFDSDIRDEFAGVFSPNFSLEDFLNLPPSSFVVSN